MMRIQQIIVAGVFVLCRVAHADIVLIGDPGNSADTNGLGAVGYTYHISATEVTIAEFQASGAGNGGEDYWNTGDRTVGTTAPAVYVSLYEAMKYCNWLTSGNVNNGLYENKGGGVWGAKYDRATVMAGSVKYFALPTEDEWYKAAYYTGNSGDLWSLYANGTDTVPIHGSFGGCNYFDLDNGFVNGPPNYTWPVGSGCEEQNFTYDMMGNVWEWMETSAGVLRGGSFSFDEEYLRSTSSNNVDPLEENPNIGFRVVAVPEPTTTLLLAVGGLGAWMLRRNRRKCH